MITTIVYDGVIYATRREVGISRYYTNLIEHLARLRSDWQFDIHIAALGVEMSLPQGANIAVRRRKHFQSRVLAPLNYASLRSRVHLSRPSLIHVTLGRAYPLKSCPIVTTIHDLILHRVQQYYGHSRFDDARALWERSARHSDAIITVSNTSKRDIMNILDIDPDKIKVTHPGVSGSMRPSNHEELTAFREQHRLVRPYVLYVGHRGEHKNFGLLARSFHHSERLRAYDLLVVGGEDMIVERQTLSQNLGDRLHHLQNLDDEGLRRAYGAAEALVFPSLCEGFGFPLVEAMACGCPVVASDIPSTREVCEDACRLFALGDPAECANAIVSAIEPDHRARLVERGLSRAAYFSWGKCARETMCVYESLF